MSACKAIEQKLGGKTFLSAL